ncbi:DUF1127 domain-containing protein [Mesorhizobium sp. CAU 1741]|uniref:DUF1127 domain-containing protein n=1 Tax=Mesorhizobium sp. CAU 1741 TaxID=3140366 RepID=UPI00325AF3CE
MTALDHPTHAIGAGTRTVATVARLTEVLRMFVRSVKNRRELNHLWRLSDHELADIGLMRTDIEVVTHAPLGVDPTVRLNRIARERGMVEMSARRVC